MDNNDIKQALQELEPEEASQIALSYLRGAGYVVKVWCRDDILGVAEQDPEFDTLSEDEKALVLDYAEGSAEFQNLEDSTDADWDAVSQAIDSGIMYVRGQEA